MKKKIISANINASSNTSFNEVKVKRLRAKLNELFNYVDQLDDATYSAVDGKNIQDDIDIYLRQVVQLLERE